MELQASRIESVVMGIDCCHGSGSRVGSMLRSSSGGVESLCKDSIDRFNGSRFSSSVPWICFRLSFHFFLFNFFFPFIFVI